MSVRSIDAQKAKSLIDSGEAIFIDVREPAENKAQSIHDALLKPLGEISANDISGIKQSVIIHCQKGVRGQKACEKILADFSEADIYNLEGGIESWVKAGFDVNNGSSKVLPLDRQVQLCIGLSVLTFSLLAYFVNPAFAFGAAFFGAGLTNAGLTGWCGLGLLMAKMPWNQ